MLAISFSDNWLWRVLYPDISTERLLTGSLQCGAIHTIDAKVVFPRQIVGTLRIYPAFNPLFEWLGLSLADMIGGCAVRLDVDIE